MADQIAGSDFPKARKVSLPQLSDFSQLLLNVATGKADATIAATHEALLFNKNNKRKLKRVDVGQPIRVFPNVFFFNKGETKLASMLNAAIDEIEYKGELDSIINQYEPVPGAFYRAAHPYRTV
jgi:ABC-type amino acid transport substrate-binding protein